MPWYILYSDGGSGGETPPVFTPTAIYATDADFNLTISRIAAEEEPEYTAWTYFVTNYVTPYVSSTPTPASPGDVETYTALDTDSRRCRNLAIAWRLSGNATYGAQVVNYLTAWSDPETGGTPYTGSEQNAYHQSYGLYSFALAYQVAYDLFSTEQRGQIAAWFQTWADAMKSMMDAWATNWYFSNTQPLNYAWELEGGGYLTVDGQDWYEGRDATAAPMCAWLAAAICCGDTADVTNITTQHRLQLPTVLHSACAGVNGGDGVVGHPVPVPTTSIRSTIDYMTYNARVLTMAYTLLENLDLATETQNDELYDTWVYLSRFFGTSPEAVPRPGDTINHSVADARFQMPLKLWPTDEFLDDVENSTVDPTQFYEPQFLGPMTLVAPASPQVGGLALSATHASIGDQLTIYGTNFGSSQGDSVVYFGEYLNPVGIRPATREAASYVSWSDTQIVVTVPSMSPGVSGAENTYHPVYVVVGDEESNRSNFYIDPVTTYTGQTYEGYSLTATSHDVLFNGCTFWSETAEVAAMRISAQSAQETYNVTFYDCTFGTSVYNGVSINTYDGSVHDVTFASCDWLTCTRMGFECTNRATTGTGGYSNINLLDCVFEVQGSQAISYDSAEDAGASGYSLVKNVLVKGAGNGTTYAWRYSFELNNVSHMTMDNLTLYLSYASTLNLDCEDCLWTGCAFDMSTSYLTCNPLVQTDVNGPSGRVVGGTVVDNIFDDCVFTSGQQVRARFATFDGDDTGNDFSTCTFTGYDHLNWEDALSPGWDWWDARDPYCPENGNTYPAHADIEYDRVTP